jgi:predicted dehydrogenase
MARKPMRVAVVGCGSQGRHHLRYLRELASVELVAVCDRDEGRLATATDDFGVPAGFRDHGELLRSTPVDLLTVCTMPNSHREIALDAFAAGAGVLCEKPMAATLGDACAMADAAERSGCFLSVGFNLRYSSAAQAVRAFVEEGRLGAPVCARGAMLETEIPWWGPHQVSDISGGGVIASTAVHIIDLLMWLAGSPRPTTATASAARLFPRKRAAAVPPAAHADRYNVEDLAFGHVRFESGFWMTIESAWTWDEPGHECRFDLVGDRAHASAAPLRFSAERSGRLVDLTEGAHGDFDFSASIERELADVVAAVGEGHAPLVTAWQALEAQAVVDALYRSAATGAEVAVANVRDRAPAGARGRWATVATGNEERG